MLELYACMSVSSIQEETEDRNEALLISVSLYLIESLTQTKYSVKLQKANEYVMTPFVPAYAFDHKAWSGQNQEPERTHSPKATPKPRSM